MSGLDYHITEGEAHIRNPGWRFISYVHFALDEVPEGPAHIRNPGWRPISYVHFVSEEVPDFQTAYSLSGLDDYVPASVVVYVFTYLN